jgi:hypothetical protein
MVSLNFGKIAFILILQLENHSIHNALKSFVGCFYLASNRIKFRLMTTKVTPTSAAIAKTRLPYPKNS